ncbi:hypothetical protein SISNIDRAFT_449803 [Sistotremastrum niveocremeum HHB9708]|uniref:Uncharacterized protein n=1 Tax=Sistotremastrum niveocremeum HHB9708 TaxID=1314777 RepID=A0A164YNF8_9AGAM|nr:hypothetical protein SISNIDRAFT_449803 [Sistotremastrum niveocremeum HHB9708]
MQQLATGRLSAVSRGTAFESRALETLKSLSMSLTRVGGKSDGGIDLQGWWWLPSLVDSQDSISSTSTSTTSASASALRSHTRTPGRRRIRVLGQCKAEKKKLGPRNVREMEGVVSRFMAMPRTFDAQSSVHPQPSSPEDSTIHQPTQTDLVAILVSQSAFTKATLLQAQSSPIPFFLLHLPDHSDFQTSPPSPATLLDPDMQNLSIGSAVWNPALGGRSGLLKGEFELRWEWDSRSSKSSISGTEPAGRPGLWFQGTKLKSWVDGDENLSLANG